MLVLAGSGEMFGGRGSPVNVVVAYQPLQVGGSTLFWTLLGIASSAESGLELGSIVPS